MPPRKLYMVNEIVNQYMYKANISRSMKTHPSSSPRNITPKTWTMDKVIWIHDAGLLVVAVHTHSHEKIKREFNIYTEKEKIYIIKDEAYNNTHANHIFIRTIS
jgi:hypothetical protein